jgi:hypothetical protein
MAVISISEAARTWRMARSTLQRALQEGRLSAMVRGDGSKGIDTAELIRVFGEAPIALQEHGSSEVERATPLAADSTIATLQAQVDSLQAQLQEARQREAWLQSIIEQCPPRLLRHLDKLPPLSIAATRSLAPDPHRETVLRASVKGTSKGCTRFRSRM